VCDTVVVRREREILFAKNSDRDPNEAQVLTWLPRRMHEPRSAVACTWIAIPQVERTWAVLLSRPYWMWGAEMGANERGVVVGNEAVFTREPLAPRGLLGMDLVRLALERAASAEEAVSVVCDLIARHGQGGRCGYDDAGFSYHNSFVVADAVSAFVVETAGRHREVERVTAPVRAISNGLTIPGFARRFADPLRGVVARCRVRRARVEALASRATTPGELSAALRDHGAGHAMPRYRAINGAMAGPCMHAGGFVASSQTVSSWISRLRVEGAQHYATATSAPCLSAFKRVDLGVPIDMGAPSGIEDVASVWWRFERLHRSVVGDPRATGALRAARDEWERATWDGTRAPEGAFAHWDRFVSAELARVERSRSRPNDERPAFVRRYWLARDRDAHAASPRLPPHSAAAAPRREPHRAESVSTSQSQPLPISSNPDARS